MRVTFTKHSMRANTWGIHVAVPRPYTVRVGFFTPGETHLKQFRIAAEHVYKYYGIPTGVTLARLNKEYAKQRLLGTFSNG